MIYIQFKSKHTKKQFIIDSIDSKTNWLLLRPFQSNVKDWHCIELNISKIVDISSLCRYGLKDEMIIEV